MPTSAFWQPPLAELLATLRAGRDGLGAAEVEARRAVFGPNLLRPHRERALAIEFLLRLRSRVAVRASVLRDGKMQELPVAELVRER